MPSGRVITRCMAALCGAAMTLAGPFAMSGCVTEQRGGGQKVPENQPGWVVPSRLLAAIQLPEDTEANGYLDTIPVTVYLFDERYPMAISAVGEFVFRLHDANGKSIGQWTMDAQASKAAERKMRPGPGYQFRLDVRKFGTDVRDSATVDMTVQFVPERGEAVLGSSATTFRLGKAGGL